jgi:group I intron endonuclease
MSIYSIYKSTNKINGKNYIGFDSNWPQRQKDHLHKYKTINTKFYCAIRKYGWENFEWEVIYQSKDGNYCLVVMEKYFINEYNSLSEGYNMTIGGEGVMLGRKHKNETLMKMSLSHLGKKPSEEHLKNQKTKLNEFYDNNGSRINKICPICTKEFITLRFKNYITCSRSCSSTYRNLNRFRI